MTKSQNGEVSSKCMKQRFGRYVLLGGYGCLVALAGVLVVLFDFNLDWGNPFWWFVILSGIPASAVIILFCVRKLLSAFLATSSEKLAFRHDGFWRPFSVVLGIVVGSAVLIATTWGFQESLNRLGDAGSFVSGTLGVSASIIGTVVSVYIAGLAYKMAYNVQSYTYLERYQNHRNEAIHVVRALQNYQRSMELHFKALIKKTKEFQITLQPQVDVAHIKYLLAEGSVLQNFYGEYPIDTIEHLSGYIYQQLNQLNERNIQEAKDISGDYMKAVDAQDLSKTYRGYYAEQLQWLSWDDDRKYKKWLELIGPIVQELKAMADLLAEIQSNSALFPVLSSHSDGLYAAEDYLLGLQRELDKIRESSPEGLAASAFLAYAYIQHWLPELLQNQNEDSVDRDDGALLFTSLMLKILAEPQKDFIDALNVRLLHYQLVDYLYDMLSWLPESSDDLDRIYYAKLIDPETQQPERFYVAYNRRPSILERQRQLQMLVQRLQPERSSEANIRMQDDPAKEYFYHADNRLKVLRKTSSSQEVQNYFEEVS